MSQSSLRVKDVAEVINGFPFDAKEFTDVGDIPLVRIRDLSSEAFETFVPKESAPESAMIRDGDVVIGMDGDFNAVHWKRGPAALNQRLCLLRVGVNADSRFVAYSVPRLLNEINDLTYATTVKHLSSKQVADLRLHIVSVSSQRAIANYLDRETAQIDTLIANQEKLIWLLRERRGSVEIDLLDVRPRRRLKELIDSERPLTYGIVQAGEPVDEGVQYIGPSDMNGHHGVPDPSALRKTSHEIADQYQRSKVAGGDLIVSIGPAFGKTMVVPPVLTGANLTQDTARIACNPNLVWNEFVLRVLRSKFARDYWESEIAGATFRRLNLNTLATTPIPCPPLNEQHAIVASLDAETAKIDALIAKAEQFIALSKERRAALITAAVTGQLEIQGVAA